MFKIAVRGRGGAQLPEDPVERLDAICATPVTEAAIIKDPEWTYQRLINFTFPIAQVENGNAPSKDLVWFDVSNYQVSRVALLDECYDVEFVLRIVREKDEGRGRTLRSSQDLPHEEVRGVLNDFFGVALDWHNHQAADLTLLVARTFAKGQINLKYRGVIKDNMGLRKFPFDSQELHLMFEVRLQDGLHLVHGGADRLASQSLSDYTFFAPTLMMYSRKPQYRVVTISVSAVRQYMFYVWTYYFQLGALASCFPLVILIDREAVSDRLAYVITLILASVAIKITMTESLPNIPYATKLSTYVYVSFLVMVLSLFVSALSNVFRDVENYEYFTSGTLAGAWLLFNIVHFIDVLKIVRLTSSKLGAPLPRVRTGDQSNKIAQNMLAELGPQFKAKLELTRMMGSK